MNTEHQNVARKGSSWLRVAGFLTYTLAAPVISALLEQLHQGSQLGRGQVQALQEHAQTAQTASLNRLEELTTDMRQLVTAQVQQLQEQSRQLEALRRPLRTPGARKGDHA